MKHSKYGLILVILTAVTGLSGCGPLWEYSWNRSISRMIMEDTIESITDEITDSIAEEIEYGLPPYVAPEKDQKIEVIALPDEELLLSTEDQREIYQFVNNLNIPKWQMIDYLPDDAEPLYAYIYYSQPTRDVGTDRPPSQSWKEVIYQGADGYYLADHSIGVSDYLDSLETYYRIPDYAADYESLVRQ